MNVVTEIPGLTTRGVSIAQIVELCPCRAPTDTVLLVGSVVEGLGNSLSDIDVLYIAEAPTICGVHLKEVEFSQTVQRLAGGEEINILYWQPSRLMDLADEFRAAVGLRAPSGVGRAIRVFSWQELRLMHRIGRGVPIAGDAEYWRQTMAVSHLPDYLLLYYVSVHYTYREDAVGQLLEGQDESAAFMMRRCAEYLTSAVLAHHEETNPNDKWLPRLLDQTRGSIEDRDWRFLKASLFFQPSPDSRELFSRFAVQADDLIARLFQARPHLQPAAANLSKRLQATTTLPRSDA